MALDVVTLFIGAIALFLLAIAFFGLLRMSNKLFTRRLSVVNEQQMTLEKLVGKFIDMTVENRKEIASLKKELEKGEKAQEPIKAEIKTEEPIAAEAAEKSLARTRKKC